MRLLIDSDKKSRPAILAAKLAAPRVRPLGSWRRLIPGKLAQPLICCLTVQTTDHPTIAGQAWLLTPQQWKDLPTLLTRLTAAQLRALQVTLVGDSWLLTLPDDQQLPNYCGIIGLRVITAETGKLWLPTNWEFQPRLTDKQVRQLFDDASSDWVLMVQAGEIKGYQIQPQHFRPLLELIALPFVAAASGLVPRTLSPRATTANQEITNALASLPKIEQILALPPTNPNTRNGWRQWAQRLRRAVQELKNFPPQTFRTFRQTLLQTIKLIFATTTPRSAATNSAPNVRLHLDHNRARPAKWRQWWRQLWAPATNHQDVLLPANATNPATNKSSTTAAARFTAWRHHWSARARIAALLHVPGLARLVWGKQQEHLLHTLELFRQGRIEDALRWAIPLNKDGESHPRQLSLQWNKPRQRETIDFSLRELLAKGGRGQSMLLPDNHYQNLYACYEQAAQNSLEAKKYREAAYIYAHLLADYLRAAQVLAQGGYHREAAVLYIEKLKSLANGAAELAAAGDYHLAAHFAQQAQEYRRAVEYLRLSGDPAAIQVGIEAWVQALLAQNNPVAAAKILVRELRDLERAASVLMQAYPQRRSQSRIEIGLQAAELCLQLGQMAKLQNLLQRMRTDLTNPELVGERGSGQATAALFRYAAGVLHLERTCRTLNQPSLGLERWAWSWLAQAAQQFALWGFTGQLADVLAVLKQEAQARESGPLLLADVEQAITMLQSYAVTVKQPTIELPGGRPTNGITSLQYRVGWLMLGRSDGRLECRALQLDAESLTVRTLERRFIGPYRYLISGVAADASGNLVALLAADGVVTVWQEGRLLMDFRDPAAPYTAICSVIDADRLILGNSKGKIVVFDLQQGRKLDEADFGKLIFTFAYDANTGLLACGGMHNQIDIYEVIASGKLTFLRGVVAEFTNVRALAIRQVPNLQLAFGNEQGRLGVVSLEWKKGTQTNTINVLTRWRLQPQNHWINILVFAPQGMLAAAGYDRRIYLHQLQHSQPLVLSGHQHEIIGLHFLNDTVLFSADKQGTVAIWHLPRHQLIYSFQVGE
jgi:hypothetical protein